MSVGLWKPLIFAIFFVAPSTPELTSEIARSCQSPVNRLEYTETQCVDSLDRRIPGPNSTQYHRVFCDIVMAVWDGGKSSSISTHNVSMDDLKNALPSPLKDQLLPLRDSLEAAVVNFEKNATTYKVDAYCKFKLNEVVFSSSSVDSFLGICAPIKQFSNYLQAVFAIGIDRIFPTITGNISFTYSVDGHGRDMRMPVRYEKDSIELSLYNKRSFANNLIGDIYYIAIVFHLENRASNSDVAVTMEVNLLRSNLTRYLCDDDTEKTVFTKTNITIECAIRDTDSWPILNILQRFAARNITFKRDDETSQLYLSNWIGHYFVFCKYTAVRVPLKSGGYLNLCGSVYFTNRTRVKEAYHVTLLRAINDAELETLQKKWTVQPAVIHSNPELTYQYERKKVTVLLRACQPDLTNPKCDSEWSQDVLDNSTMQKVVKTLCAEGPISKEINYTTTAAYCCLAHDYYHIAPVVYSWGYSASCWDLNYRKDRSCKIVDGMCECCCFASPLNARAATSVPCNLEFEGLYNNCKRELKFGRLNFSEPNVMKIPKEIPSGKEIILPVEDLKDTCYRYDNLMEFFQMDLKNLTLQQSGVVNPIGHRYAAKNTETSKLAVHSSKNRVYCAVENWNVKDLAMGCKCFRTRETLVNCCCQRNAGTTTLHAYSMALLYKQRNWNYTALAHTLRYREEFLVNRTAILRPE